MTGITVGALTLTPAFDAGVTEYTATTESSAGYVTATAAEGATIETTLNDVEFTNDTGVVWTAGENVVEITVTEEGKEPTVYTVTVTYTAPAPEPETPDATLSALTVGNLTLTPTFDKDTTTYTVTTSNSTNKVTATATDENATIAILLGETSIENESSPSWNVGENVLTITVTNSTEIKTYTVTVTKE